MKNNGGTKVMRIAVISLKVNSNYGGLLQAWAFQQVLKRLGHRVELIDPPCSQRYFVVKKTVLLSSQIFGQEVFPFYKAY